MSGAAARQRRRSAAIAASLIAHLVVFALIARNVPNLVFREPPVEAANIWLMPRLTPQTHQAKARAMASSAARSLPAASRAEPRPPPLDAPAPAASPPSEAPSGPAGPPALAPGAGESLQGALRSRFGCDIGRATHLTPEEKDRCNQRMGEEARRGPAFIDTIPPEKRAYYDAVQAAYQAARDPQHPYVRDANGDVQLWGKGPGVACGMKFGGPHQPPDHRSWSDKVKATGLLGGDIGPFRCGIVIPQGSMTPEIGIPVP